MSGKPTLALIYDAIINSSEQSKHNLSGYLPLYVADESAKILVVGQAPGLKTQLKNILWDDASGNRLREWFGVSREEFYNEKIFAHLPIDFYYPGKGRTGDLPPRISFAKKWHPLILANLVNIKLIILIGKYAQDFYLGDRVFKTLTETVKNYNNYLPLYLPIPHPSPLNNRWLVKNEWFIKDVLPILKVQISKLINS